MLVRRNFLAYSGILPILGNWPLSGFCAKNQKEIASVTNIPPKEFMGGEFLGSVANGEKVGVQIAPTTPERFAIHVYSGGLPGLGYNGLWQQTLKGKQKGSEPNFFAEADGWTIDGNLETIKGSNKKGLEIHAERIPNRSLKSLGIKPPTNGKILFDGDLGGWKRAQKDSDGYLMVGCETLDSFKDFLLHLEFRLPFLPEQKGQDRANSGVYIQNRYEIQILDSFALEGSKNQCGSIYEFRPPEVNACLPPEQWQSFDIEFRSARFADRKKVKNAMISVTHNGVLVHDQIEIPSQTGYGRKEGPDSGPIHLQNHGSKVVFRNIWIVERK